MLDRLDDRVAARVQGGGVEIRGIPSLAGEKIHNGIQRTGYQFWRVVQIEVAAAAIVVCPAERLQEPASDFQIVPLTERQGVRRGV
jgi:hypothetical protein